jgi:L-ascorbate metabolism protein UlaG (beta-lactamase superfamily)
MRSARFAWYVSVLLIAGLFGSPAQARVAATVQVITHAAVKIEANGKKIYIDPTGIVRATADADIVLITHDHSDHFDLTSIGNVAKPGTVFVASQSCVAALQAQFRITVMAASPGWRTTIGDIQIEAVAAYNLAKSQYHPSSADYVGYVVTVNGVRIYHAGDTERIPEMKTFTCDVALLPLGQTYTMNSVDEAAAAALDVQAKIAIPIHWGTNEGSYADALRFQTLLNGRVQVVITTGTGFAVTVDDPPPLPPPTIRDHPVSQTVAAGGNATFSVAATGTGTLSYQWRCNGQPIAAATGATFSLGTVTPAQAGDYTVLVSDANGATTSRLARLTVATPEPGRLLSLSVRTVARSKSVPLILGFVVSGGSKPLLIRGVGPALAGFGVAGALPDPMLEVHTTLNGQDTITASNNDWSAGGVAALRAAFVASGAFDLADSASKDAALLHSVDGLRSVFVYDVENRSGVTLVELYDTGSGNAARLTSLSARNYVGTGDNILIAGFTLSGNTPKRLLIRGVGPRLSGFGVPGALADPRLEVYMVKPDGSNVLFATNDNWGESDVAAMRTAFTATSAFDLPDPASKDAALLLTLPAGVFTAQVAGVANTTGEALIEVYEAL